VVVGHVAFRVRKKPSGRAGINFRAQTQATCATCSQIEGSGNRPTTAGAETSQSFGAIQWPKPWPSGPRQTWP
jgi:hypothetical protein